MDIFHPLQQTLTIGEEELAVVGVFAVMYAANRFLNRLEASRQAEDDQRLPRQAASCSAGYTSQPAGRA